MELSLWVDQRKAASRKRQRPRPQHQEQLRYVVPGDGAHPPNSTPNPTDLLIEATSADGEMVPWFDDCWWMECLARWKDSTLTVHILPSPAALFHPVVFHHVEMMRRLVPTWRIVGYGWLEEMDLDAAPEAIARSPYQEVRIIDSPMPDSVGSKNPRHAARLEDLIGAVRRAQRELGRTMPVLTRCAEAPVATSERTADVRAAARMS